MADEEEEAEGKGKGKGKGDKAAKPKSNLVPAVVVTIGLVVGGKMMGGGKAAAPATAASVVAAGGAHGEGEPMDCATEDILHPPVEGGVYKLESMPINLADGHYAKVGVALQLAASVNLELFKEEGEEFKAKDVVISIITGRDKAEFASPQAMESLKEKITEELRPKYHCEVIEVLFTEFVIQ